MKTKIALLLSVALMLSACSFNTSQGQGKLTLNTQKYTCGDFVTKAEAVMKKKNKDLETIQLILDIGTNAGCVEKEAYTKLEAYYEYLQSSQPQNVPDTNYPQAQGTSLSVSAFANSRVGGQSSTESVMTFTATSHPNRAVEVRQGATVAFAVEGTDRGGENVTTISDTSVSVDGSSSKLTAGAGVADNDSFYFLAGDMTNYSRASFWLNVTDQLADQSIDTVDYTRVTYFTAADYDAVGDNSAVLANPVTRPLSGSWYFFDVAIPIGTTSYDRNFGFELDDVSELTNDTGGFEEGDTVNVDQFRLYNEKINIDLRLSENWASVTPTIAYLKQNNQIVADAYVDFDGAVASRTGQIQFVPVGIYAGIQIDGVDTFAVQMDTTTAITEDSGVTENLTATIDFGNASTAGDIFWYDGEDTINFLGINATDRVSVVSQY